MKSKQRRRCAGKQTGCPEQGVGELGTNKSRLDRALGHRLLRLKNSDE